MLPSIQLLFCRVVNSGQKWSTSVRARVSVEGNVREVSMMKVMKKFYFSFVSLLLMLLLHIFSRQQYHREEGARRQDNMFRFLRRVFGIKNMCVFTRPIAPIPYYSMTYICGRPTLVGVT
jgi:hypothetical protein